MERIVEPEAFLQLIQHSTPATVEDAWMRLLDAVPRCGDALPAEKLVDYDVVLRALCEIGETSRAAAFAWAALETVATRQAPVETLPLAKAFLLAVGESDDLRAQVTEVYRSAYADCEGLEGLLRESGLLGQRPVRRALRTLDVCLPLHEGDFLAARDEDEAARVETVDRTSWRISITGPRGSETLGAVPLADRFRPAQASEFQIMYQFAPEALIQRLWEDPVPVVIELCRKQGAGSPARLSACAAQAGNARAGIDSDALEAILVPRLLSAAEWNRWWPQARTALRRSPHIQIDGRSPCRVSYVDKPIALEDGILKKLGRTRDPLAQLDLVENYLRECKRRGQTANPQLLHDCVARFAQRARQLEKTGAPEAGLWWIIVRRVVESTGLKNESDGTVEFFRTVRDLGPVLSEIKRESLVALACDAWIAAHPDDGTEALLGALPLLPQGACDRAVARLLSAGRSAGDFQPVMQEILAEPVAHFEALLWLWDGPAREDALPMPSPVPLFASIVRALDEARRSDQIPKAAAKKIAARARSVLAARNYERFQRCLDVLDPAMAGALSTRIKPLDNLGRTVPEKLLAKLHERFPQPSASPRVEPWLREDVLFVTEAGLARKHAEIDRHLNEKMRQNAQAIGRAAEHGDLSENAEYKFALEERDLLRARLAQMNSELERAQVLSPDDVPTDFVGIGTRVVLRRLSDGAPYELVCVGPWEADADRGWVNYRTPLARKVLGRRIGDVVSFDHSAAKGEYEIVALDNALISGG